MSVESSKKIVLTVKDEGMPPRPTVETLAVQFEAHQEAFGEAQDRAMAAQRELHVKMDNLLLRVEEGLTKVHRRVDALFAQENKKERDFYRCVIKWGAGVFSGTVLLFLAVVGYLITEGPPWTP